MRLVVTGALALSFLTGALVAQQPAQQPKMAPKVVLQSPDGKRSYDLAKLVENGPVLIRLTCACTGCDAELASFQKLQAAYQDKGLQTIAVFNEKPEALEQYVVKKNINFMWLSDKGGALWKTFDAKTMPTNILIEKGGKVCRVVAGCTVDGKNAQILSDEIAKVLQVPSVKIAEPKAKTPAK